MPRQRTALTVHTVPFREFHHAESHDCPCGPRVEQVCPVCDGEAEAAEGCWRCRGEGWVECVAPTLYDGRFGLHVVHRETPAPVVSVALDGAA